MWCLYLLSWVAMFIQLVFLTITMTSFDTVSAVGNLHRFLKNFIARNLTFSEKVIRTLSVVVIFLYLNLMLFKELPRSMIVSGIVGQVFHLYILRCFPFVPALSPLHSKVIAIVIFFTNNLLASYCFSRELYLSWNTMSEVLAYYTLCLWMGPVALFTFLAAKEKVQQEIMEEFVNEQDYEAEIDEPESEPEHEIGDLFLHSPECQGQVQDLMFMMNLLVNDPGALNRLSNKKIQRGYPLQDAVKKDHVACVKFLIENGAYMYPMTGKKNTEYTILEEAVKNKNSEIVEYLLENGYDPNFEYSMFRDKTVALQLACATNDVPIVKLLLEHNAITEDVEYLRETDSVTPMVVAALHGNKECMKQLFLYGAKPGLSEIDNLTFEPMTLHSDFYSLAHIIVENRERKSIDDQKKMLNMIYEFGGDLLLENSQGIDLLQMAYVEMENEELGEYIENLMNKPLSMQSQCRLVIRNVVNKNYLKKITTFKGFPKCIRSILEYDEV